MYCPNCGKKIKEEADFCLNCGKKVVTTSKKIISVEEGKTFWWGVLSFFIPIIGLILFILWKKERPKTSKSAGIGALIGVIFSAILGIVGFTIGIMNLEFEEETDYRCKEASCNSCYANSKTCTYFDGEDFEILTCPCESNKYQ